MRPPFYVYHSTSTNTKMIITPTSRVVKPVIQCWERAGELCKIRVAIFVDELLSVPLTFGFAMDCPDVRVGSDDFRNKYGWVAWCLLVG